MKHSVKRVAAIHDLSGFGRASLTAIIPILSSMGVQVCPLPTVELQEETIKNQQGWGYICVRNFAANYN